jgi:hypothetical protein
MLTINEAVTDPSNDDAYEYLRCSLISCWYCHKQQHHQTCE